MGMTRAQFRKSLEPGLNTQFGLAYKRYKDQWPRIYAIENSDKAWEEDNLLVGFGGAPVKSEGSGISYDQGGESWTARYQHETIALAFAITEEAMEDGQYGNLAKKYAPALARSLKHTKEVKGASVLNNGFDSSYTGGDGKSLFATDHPLWGGGTAPNKLDTPADLAEASLEEMLNLIGEFEDDRHIPVNAMVKCLIIPTELQWTARRLLHSTKRPGTADNDVNAVADAGSIEDFYVNRYLTDPDAWFLITDVPDGLKHMRRKKVQRGSEGDFESGNMRYKARERYSFGWTNWRGAAASEGGGA